MHFQDKLQHTRNFEGPDQLGRSLLEGHVCPKQPDLTDLGLLLSNT